MSPDDLIALNDQIAGMARAGLPLDRGLASLADEMGRGRLRDVTRALADDLRAGHPLPDALARRGNKVPPYYAALVTAGVRTGRVAEVLATLTAYARTVATTRAIVVESLYYPAVVAAVSFALFAFLGFTVIPQFQQIFREFNLELPLLTKVVLNVGEQPAVFVGVPAAAVAAVLLLWLVQRLTPAGRRMWARLVYAVPVVGTLLRAARIAAFSELLAVLVEHDIPLPEAFRLAGAASSDPLSARNAVATADALAAGVPLADALTGRGLVPEWVAWMAGAGARMGTLGPALRQVAVVYRRQVEARSMLLRSVLPPLLVLVTAGLLVGVFVVALMLPLIKLLEGLSK
jgi:type II secretory pathway component PulF